MSEQIVITWTKPKLREFKAAYEVACNSSVKNDTFIFEGNAFVINYARYLIEYLESQFKSL